MLSIYLVVPNTCPSLDLHDSLYLLFCNWVRGPAESTPLPAHVTFEASPVE